MTSATGPDSSPSGTRKAAGNATRGVAELIRRLGASGGLALAVLALGITAGILMVVTEFSTIVSIDTERLACEDIATVAQRDDCVKSGGEQHLYALALIGILTLLMAWGAGPGESRPAALALVAIGAFVLALALLVDLPKTDDTGVIGRDFDEAEANPGTGLWLELGAALLAVAAGVLRLRRGERPA